jgi:hypothetical protein
MGGRSTLHHAGWLLQSPSAVGINVKCVAEDELAPREQALVKAFVDAWERSNHVTFDFAPGQGFSHPHWPPDVAAPSRDEVRRLHQLDMLDVDRAAAPTWRVYPSAAARSRFDAECEQQMRAALADPDQRLGLILEASVQAFEADPAEPLRIWSMAGADLVRHRHWPLQPDVVRMHDLQQLEELRLISSSPEDRGRAFWPTTDGRAAVHDPVGLLERRSQSATSEHEASRLRRLAEKLRASDLTVSVIAGTATAAVRALIGL